MYIESHDIICPECKGHRYIGHKLCLECYGVGKIVFAQERRSIRERISNWWRNLNPEIRFTISVLFGALLVGAIVFGTLAL